MSTNNSRCAFDTDLSRSADCSLQYLLWPWWHQDAAEERLARSVSTGNSQLLVALLLGLEEEPELLAHHADVVTALPFDVGHAMENLKICGGERAASSSLRSTRTDTRALSCRCAIIRADVLALQKSDRGVARLLSSVDLFPSGAQH